MNPFEKRDHSIHGKSTVFLSRVPNCQDQQDAKLDIPGPGTYKGEISSTTELPAGHTFTFSPTKISARATKLGTDPQQPFTNPSNLHAPGPGRYYQKDSKEKVVERLKQTTAALTKS